MLKKRILYILLILLFFISNDVFAQEIRIAHFSDIHIDTKTPDREVRKFAQSVLMFRKAIRKTNILAPDLVVISGDMVNKPQESEFDVFLNNAKGFNMNFYPALGNHDVGVGGGLSKATIISKLNQNCSWLNLSSTNYYVIKDEYIFIFMDGTNDKIITSKGTFSQTALAFLDETLKQHKYKKAIIVQHFPLMPPFKSASHEITNRDEYLNLIDKHSNVIAVLSGHYHASKVIKRNNVLYISTPSMIEYPHAFRLLTITSDEKYITIKSDLIMDIDQNDKEETNGLISRLKLGLPNDNNFEEKLKNNTPAMPKLNFWNKIFAKKAW